MCNCTWVMFSIRVKPKHGTLGDYQYTASYPDDQRYQISMWKFHVTNSICDYCDLKGPYYCTAWTYFSYIL